MTTAFRFTSADLETFPYIEGVRYEIIDGELYVSTQPHNFHQHFCGMLSYALQGWIAQRGSGVVFIVPGVIFAPDQNVIPDLVCYSTDRWRDEMDEAGHCVSAPDLMVEVLSPGRVNEVRDRELKLSLYSRQGVPEYWIADWRLRTVEQYRSVDGELQLGATLGDGDTLTSPHLPGFQCPVSSLWLR